MVLLSIIGAVVIALFVCVYLKIKELARCYQEALSVILMNDDAEKKEADNSETCKA